MKKNFIKINRQLLREATRSQLINKSKKGDNYALSNQNRGKNRWERRKYSKIATQVKDFNSIDMNAFFKGDLLEFTIPVQGETNNYKVVILFEKALEEIGREVQRNNNKLEYKCILRALLRVFNSDNVYVSCDCLDFKYRFQYWSSRNQYNSGVPQSSNGKGIANPNDTKGAACKHINLCLANLDWMMKIASVINNYIWYCKDNMENNYAQYIFPKLYGMPYDKAVQLTFDNFDANGNLITDPDLVTDPATINLANALGRKRTQFKKAPQQSVNPRYVPPKKEKPLKTMFGQKIEVNSEKTEDGTNESLNEELNPKRLESRIRKIVTQYNKRKNSKLTILETDKGTFIYEYDDGQKIDFSKLTYHKDGEKEVEEGTPPLFTFILSGGLNGCGNWEDYLGDVADLIGELEDETKLHIIIQSLDTDIPDDVWTAEVLMYRDDELDESLLLEKIVKIGDKWQVQSEKGRNLGTYNTRAEAERRLKQVEYFKSLDEELHPLEDILKEKGFKFNNNPPKGASYLLPDGSFLGMEDNKDITGSVNGKSTHPDLDFWLVDNGIVDITDDANRTLVKSDNAIRLNDGTNFVTERAVIHLPDNQLTETQYKQLINWLLDVIYIESVKALDVGKDTDNNLETFYFSEEVEDGIGDVIKYIRKQY